MVEGNSCDAFFIRSYVVTKHECERYRNLCVLLGAAAIGLGVSMPFRSEPGDTW
jgi:hypothetical protein